MKHCFLKALALLCALVLMALPAMAEGLNICIISSVGVDDGNFVQDCYAGIQEFIASHPDCTVKDIKETDIAQLVPTVEKLAGDYDVFVLPGFYFATIGDIALNNPDKHFIVVDSTIQDSEGNPVSLDNVYTMIFKEQEGGFFAGVAAALSTKSGKVAVVNGMPFASNVNYQFGFMAGVNYANAKYGASAECVELPSYAGTDLSGNDVGGNYVGSFGNGVFTAAKEANGVYVIGCDADQYKDGAYGKGNIVLTSALKVMHLNVTRQLEAIYNGTFAGMDALLGVDTDSTGYVSEAGHQQLSEDALGKLAECYDLMKAGQIVPPSDTQYTPNDFPGLN